MRRARSFATVVTFVATSVLAQISGVTLTTPSLSPTIYPRLVAGASDGTVWFADERYTPHKVGYFTSSGQVKLVDIPCDGCADATNIAYIESITVGPDGNAWFPYTRVRSDGSPLDNGMNNYVGRVTRDGTFTSFPVPTQWAFRRFTLGAYGHSFITVGPDGNLWFTENVGHKVGKMTTAGALTEYPLPGGTTFPTAPTPVKTDWPSGIATGPDGNLWVAVTYADKIVRITPAGAMTEFPLAKNSLPLGITAGPDGNLWFTGAARIGSITTAGAVTSYSVPNEYPIHITTGPDKNLWFTINSRNLGRMTLPVPTSGIPVIDRLSVAPNFAYDLTFTSGTASLKSISEPAASESSAAPEPPAEVTNYVAAIPTASTPAPKRRAVQPPFRAVVGKAVLTLKMDLDADMRAALEASTDLLQKNQLVLAADGLHFPTKPAGGYRVVISDQTAMTSTDGTFRLAAMPPAVLTGTVSSMDGTFTTQFKPDALVFEGETPKPIEIALTLSTAPNGMNDYPATTAAMDHAAHADGVDLAPPDLGFPCGSHKDCLPAACPDNRCCLDYNGSCADNPLARWQCNPLRLQQFLGSTCAAWVTLGCCINEGALVNSIPGVKGPGCFDNHAGRECQIIDPTIAALQFTAGDHNEDMPPPDVRENYQLDLPTTESVSVPCGATSQFMLHNNTCANETEVTLNSVLDRLSKGISCVAGGTISPSGTVKHYAQVSEEPVSTETTGAFRHINDQVIDYTAPSDIAGCDHKGVDVIRASAGGRTRYITVAVDCSKEATTHTTIAPPYFSPPAGNYDAPFDAIVSCTTPGVEIHYTTDGTIPTILSPQIPNGGTVHVSGSTTVRARAFIRASSQTGPVASAEYDIWRRMEVQINPKPEGKLACQPATVVIGAKPGGAGTKVSYTIDGSQPSEATAKDGERFEVTINPPGPVTVKGQSFRKFRLPSEVESVTYTFDCGQQTAGTFDIWMSASDPEFNDLLLRANVVPPKAP